MRLHVQRPVVVLIALGALTLQACKSGPSERELAARERERKRREAVRSVWAKTVKDSKEGKNVVVSTGGAGPSGGAVGAAPPAGDREIWISACLRGAKALLKSKEALMAWRAYGRWLEIAPLASFEPIEKREQKRVRAGQQCVSLMNFVRKAIRDLERIEAGEVEVQVNQPGAFPVVFERPKISEDHLVEWVTGRTLPDGRYEIADPDAHDPRFEDALSLRAEAYAHEVQDRAVAARR